MKRTKILAILLFVFILTSQVFTHLVFARESGGGELGEFETDKFLMSVGIGMASTFVGGAISEGINSSAAGANFFSGGTANGVTYGGFGGAISNAGNLGTWASNFNSMAAFSQLGSGINMMGQQKGWSSSKTTMISSVVLGAVGGGLNSPAGASFADFSKAATVGAISGATEGAILANNLGSDGSVKPWVSMTAGLAGSFVGGVTAASIAPTVPSKAGSYNDYVSNGGMTKDGQSFGPVNQGWYNQNALGVTTANNFGEAFTHGAVTAFSAIPSRAISMGVNNMTKGMDRQDAFVARQAFRGVYPIAEVVYQNKISDPAFKAVGLDNYVGGNGFAGDERHKMGSQLQIIAPMQRQRVHTETRQW